MQAALRLLLRAGALPGDFFRREPGERAVICAMYMHHNRLREGVTE